MPEPPHSRLEVRALRLRPGEDLRPALEALAREGGIPAGVLLGAVGSLRRAVLRFAGREAGTALDGPFEILALNGTLGPEGAHLHAALADAGGRVTGGHVLAGCVVHTTLELAIGVLPDLAFGRRPDPDTGHDELTVTPRPGA